MQLKKLFLSGFKSFADKTVILFDSGITCIVGPNGCGKSNIVDAFLWILGEQSAKSMRGQKMQDIIFAGTTQRKPVNIAEASLTLSNSSRLLPIEYDEVTITRRLHRDGESEYLINQRQVRLKDIHHLLRDSGIGHQAFAIFEQGKIDDVIRYTAVERRFIFEEAAGISRFLHRKQESLRHLDQIQSNLERAQDIFLEVEKQVHSLTLQAEAAKAFQNYQEKLKHLETIYTLFEWDKAEKKRQSISHAMHQTEADIEKLCKEIQSKTDQGDEHAFYLNLKNEESHKNEELSQKAQNKKNLAERDLQIAGERLRETEVKEKSLNAELKKIHEFTSTYNTSTQTLQIQLKEAESRVSQKSNNSFIAEIEKAEKELLEVQNKLQIYHKQRLDLLKKNAASESECKQTEIRLGADKERQQRVQARRQNSIQDKEKKQLRMHELQEKLQELSDAINSSHTQLNDLNQEIHQANKEITKIQNEKNTLLQTELEKQARQKILLKMEENHEGFSESCKKLLQENDKPKSSLYQKITPLYQMIEPEMTKTRKFIAEGGIYAETLVVKNRADLESVFKIASTMKLNEYSILCLESLSQPLSTLFSENFSEVDSILENLTESVSQTEIWSQEGFRVDNRGVIFHFKSNQNHPFYYESELKNLKKELQLIEQQKKDREKNEVAHIKSKDRYLKEKAALEKEVRNSERTQWEYQTELKRLSEELEKSLKEDLIAEKELIQLNELLHTHQNNLEKNLTLFTQSKNLLTELQLLIDELEKEMSTKNRDLKLYQQQQREHEEILQKYLKEQQQLKYQLGLIEVKQQENNRNIERVECEITSSLSAQKSLQIKLKESHALLDSLQEECQKYKKIHQDFAHLIKEKKKEQETLKQDLTKLQFGLKKCEQELHQKNLQLAECTFLRESLERNFRERNAASIMEYLHLLQNQPSQKSVEKEIEALKEIIKQCGVVNMTSIDELSQHQDRYNDLKAQMADLHHSKEEIIGIISQLDDESRKIFKDCYELIRQNFKKNFQILFEGGEADLQLIGNGQILDAGIEIIAKPPGKQMKSLTLLSGGEKCLTALALLFAIFEVKPSPFCILDEIDAPLDDSNVDRFIKMVRHFSERSQFLVITHNKRTMAAGNSLCGVSMEEKGVSKLLTLQLSA